MKNKKAIIILLISIVVFGLTGCAAPPSDEEKEKGEAYVDQSKDQVTKYVKETYGDDAKIINMEPGYETKQEVLGFGNATYADGYVETEVKLNGEKFKVLYQTYTETFYTNKNEVKIKESFKEYVINAMGSDKILNLRLQYGVGGIYYGYPNYVDNNITIFEQLYDNNHKVYIKCILENTDVNQLKELGTFDYLEDLVFKGSDKNGFMGAVFVNVENKDELSEEVLRKIYYEEFGYKYVTVNERLYSVLTSDYTKKNPNNAYFIKFYDYEHDDKEGELISIIY